MLRSHPFSHDSYSLFFNMTKWCCMSLFGGRWQVQSGTVPGTGTVQYTGTMYSNRVHSLQVRHKAAPEVSKGNLYINQKKMHVPIEILRDMFEHFALRATLFAELFFD